MNEIWLEEPTESDESWAQIGEHTLDWLSRSTLPRARQMRLFLNYNLSQLPSTFANKLKNDLRDHWRSAFFELIVGRILQEIGYEFKHEVTLAGGNKPDFLIETSIGKIVIEATSPIINSRVGDFYKKVNPLIKILKDNAPENWVININNLPDIGFNDSKKPFKAFIEREFDNIPTNSSKEEIIITENFPQGKLKLSLIYKFDRSNPIGFYPSIGYAENSKYRIEHIIDEKRTQVREVDKPVILAIQGSNTGTDLNDFDQVLFGQTFTRMNRDMKVIEKGFNPNGLFISDNESPTYQGVLAFHEVGCKQVKIPTLYLHQKTNSQLKNIFDAFHIRYYEESNNCIKEIESQRNDYFKDFKFVTA
ncbi:hypothetical protein CK503_08435 [Aliifodinibius salipaludis]|uniref:Restriction endonuclease n=1 Tax=Fodinibius salipaludis TaxID=2032627 RepID=A0A2A2GAN3_9BACT|nr:hypothetical protein [Aliifodinibius salipaludis]PAU94230.1 hypothetical protein CK503_08435 [Aliifodinibius salipaludis]